MDIDVVFSHTNLSRNFNNRNLDVGLLQFFTQTDGISQSRNPHIRIDFGQARINSTTVLAEFQNKTSLTFINYSGVNTIHLRVENTLFVGIRTADTTWNRYKSTAN